MANNDQLWQEAKKRCRLDDKDIALAKRLGLNPRSLIKNIPSKSEPWKAPVKDWLHEIEAKRSKKAELGKPFPQEEELRVKSARLAELNAELNIDERTPMEQLADDAAISAKAERPSVLARLKNTPTRQTQDTPEKQRGQESR